MSDKITETIVLEVTGVEQRSYYPNGYSEPAETLTTISLTRGGGDSIRTANIVIPGNLPLGTRFKLEITQIDDVSAATIHRGTLPQIVESKLIGDGGVN